MVEYVISYSERNLLQGPSDAYGISVHGVILVSIGPPRPDGTNVIRSFEGLATSTSGGVLPIGSAILGTELHGCRRWSEF